MSELVPDLYIGVQLFILFCVFPLIPESVDLLGYTFTYPVVSLLACVPIGTYIHYPTIRTDVPSKRFSSLRSCMKVL